MEYIKLSDCASFRESRTNNITLENYITTENMLPNKGGITKIDSLPSVKTASKYEIGDILLSNIRPYFCKIWHANRVGSCSNDVLVVQVNENHSSKFIYYVLSDKNFFNYSTVTSKGTKMPRGTPKAIMKYLVPAISIESENIISDILSKYDELIEVNNQRIKKLEQTAEELYKEWFVRFRFPNWQNTEFENGIPNGWKTLQIKDITSLKSGYAFKSEWFTNCGNCIAKIKDIGAIIMDTSDFSYVEESNCIKARRFILNEGALTIALTGATIGKISIVPKYDITIYTNQRLGKFFNGSNPIERLPFLYCFFAQKEIVQTIFNISNSSSAQPNISPEQIENIKFRSSVTLIDLFNVKTRTIFEQILNLYYKNQNLIKQRDLLLPRLMSGKLEV